MQAGKKKSAKELIEIHVRKNRGREIPVSELRDTYGLKPSTISNAIKELEMRGVIAVERRALKHGRYAVIWLAGDTITQYFSHPDEKESARPTAIGDEVVEVSDKVDEYINMLASYQYSHDEFLNTLKALKYSPMEIALKVIQPILYKVGDLWAKTIISTGIEHLISSRLERIIISLLPSVSKHPKGEILLATIEGEGHSISLVILELILGEKYRMYNLRRTIPIRSLIEFLRGMERLPDWVFITITLESFVGTLIHQIKHLRDIFGNELKIAVGGQGIQRSDESLFVDVDMVITSPQRFINFMNHLLEN